MYDSTTGCNSGDLSAIYAAKDGYCFSRTDAGYSYKYSYPRSYVYYSTTCSGSNTTNTMSTSCAVDAADDYSNYYFSYDHIERSYIWSKVAATTSTPTIARKFLIPYFTTICNLFILATRTPTTSPMSLSPVSTPNVVPTSAPQSSSSPVSDG